MPLPPLRQIAGLLLVILATLLATTAKVAWALHSAGSCDVVFFFGYGQALNHSTLAELYARDPMFNHTPATGLLVGGALPARARRLRQLRRELSFPRNRGGPRRDRRAALGAPAHRPAAVVGARPVRRQPGVHHGLRLSRKRRSADGALPHLGSRRPARAQAGALRRALRRRLQREGNAGRPRAGVSCLVVAARSARVRALLRRRRRARARRMRDSAGAISRPLFAQGVRLRQLLGKLGHHLLAARNGLR